MGGVVCLLPPNAVTFSGTSAACHFVVIESMGGTSLGGPLRIGAKNQHKFADLNHIPVVEFVLADSVCVDRGPVLTSQVLDKCAVLFLDDLAWCLLTEMSGKMRPQSFPRPMIVVCRINS